MPENSDHSLVTASTLRLNECGVGRDRVRRGVLKDGSGRATVRVEPQQARVTRVGVAGIIRGAWEQALSPHSSSRSVPDQE